MNASDSPGGEPSDRDSFSRHATNDPIKFVSTVAPISQEEADNWATQLRAEVGNQHSIATPHVVDVEDRKLRPRPNLALGGQETD